MPALRANGLGIGFSANADRTVVRYNRIHDVGQCKAYDHLVYLAHGDGVQIYDNWMWNDPHGFGVQVYPGPTNAHIFANVIDAAGTGMIIGSGSNNELNHNVVTDSTGLSDAGLPQGVAVHAYQPGTGNSFHDDLSFNNPGGIYGNISGIAVSNNVTADPQYVDASTHDYRVKAGSPAASFGLWDGDLTSQATFGTTTVGAGAWHVYPDAKRANAYTVSSAVSVSKLSMYLQPTGAVGTELLRGVIYTDSNGSPGALVATSNEISFANTNSAGWYDMPFATPVLLPAGKYWIGHLSGGTFVADYREDQVPGARAYNSNAYTSGASNPWGATNRDGDQISLYATYTPASPSTFGKASVGASSDSMAADRKRVNAYSVSSSAAVSKLSIYLQPTGTSGQQVLRGVIYADSGGAPGALVAVSNELSFAGTQAAGWYDLTLPGAVTLSPGRYWIGMISGGSSYVAGFRWDSVSASRVFNSNTYTSGPTNPFGAVGASDSEQMSIYATYTSG